MTDRVWIRGAVALVLAAGISGCAAVLPAPDGEAEAQVAAVDPAGDACGAAARQDLVGTSVGDLEAASLPENSRTIFPGMMVTQDFLPERLNVDVGTDDRIARVYCG